ncbi:MAG: MarR family transcriptional regulator [Gammaproteobacteria bacterium]|nr:MarR family transcriptional regulator [Gammaproteobacteria bacterium]
MSSKKLHQHIERLSNLLRNEARTSGMDYGLQPIQLEALCYLSNCNRYSDSPIGVTEYLGLTKGTVSQTLNVLHSKGLIRRISDKKDKRVTHLKLTTASKKLLDKAVPAPMLRRAYEGLQKEKQIRLVNDLKQLLTTIQRSNTMKSFGVCNTCRFNRCIETGQYFCELTQEALSPNDIQLICREHSSETGS